MKKSVLILLTFGAGKLKNVIKYDDRWHGKPVKSKVSRIGKAIATPFLKEP